MSNQFKGETFEVASKRHDRVKLRKQHDKPEQGSGMAGSGNQSLGKGQGDGSAQEVAGTLSSDFTLSGMKAEYKGEDNTTSNQIPEGSDGDKSLSTMGNAASDSKHESYQSHEIDPAPGRENSSTQGSGAGVDPAGSQRSSNFS